MKLMSLCCLPVLGENTALCYRHHGEGEHLVPSIGEWRKSRELHRENQSWPCQRWQPPVPQITSGKQSIKGRTTCHPHCFFSASCWHTEASDRPAFSGRKWYPQSCPHHCSQFRVAQLCSADSDMNHYCVSFISFYRLWLAVIPFQKLN